MLRETLKNFYAGILGGEIETLLSLFSDEPLINTPLQGEIRGKANFIRYLSDQRTFLKEHEAKAELFALTDTDQRIVVESVLYLKHGSKNIDLPVAIVADRSRNTASEIRVYHSTWPLTGKHAVRPPLMSPAMHLDEPLIIEKYMDELAKPDKAAILELFEEDGYVREPSGSSYKHSGPAGRKEFYDAALAEGGISLKHCTATFDGTRFIVEFICDEWGKTKLPPQAGMAVYEMGKTGKLFAVRIYDDLSPPGRAPNTSPYIFKS